VVLKSTVAARIKALREKRFARIGIEMLMFSL
jgi:hypothetical protein